MMPPVTAAKDSTLLFESEVVSLSVLPDGVVVARLNDGMYEELEHAKLAGNAITEFCGGSGARVMVVFGKAKGQSREAREYWASTNVVGRAALVIGSPLSRVLGNIYMGIQKPKMPTRLFTLEAEALAWLARDD